MSEDRFFAAYLARIGATRPAIDLAGLSALMQAHLQTVPFENLDIVARRPRPLTTEESLEKIVRLRRGGFCYEMNEAFRALLHWLGFTVRRIEARVWQPDRDRYGDPFDHLALVVTLAGAEYLVDVGFGDGNRAPLRLPEDSMEDVSGRYHLGPCEDGLLLLRSEKRPLYRLTLAAQTLEAFQAMCRFHQTSPLSFFAQGLICTRATPVGRMTLTDRLLSVTEAGSRLETEALDRDAILATHFGIADWQDAPMA